MIAQLNSNCENLKLENNTLKEKIKEMDVLISEKIQKEIQEVNIYFINLINTFIKKAI